MKDEIKEILDRIKYHIEEDDYFEIEGHFLKPLFDYITNLQNENMKYDQCLTELTDNYKDLQKELTNLQDKYKEADYDRHKLFEAKEKLKNDYQEAIDKITNLQEENERLKSQLLQDNKSYYDMQDRIKKAIEYIEEFYDRNEEVIEAFNFEYSYKHIISLLQGKSDE